MHDAVVADDVGEVREDVVVRECDELAPTPIHLAEEMVSVEQVGEGDGVADHKRAVAVIVLLKPEHAWRARREVTVAGGEEEVCYIPCTPPPRKCPHSQLVLDDDPGRKPYLRHGGRASERRSVVLHDG